MLLEEEEEAGRTRAALALIPAETDAGQDVGNAGDHELRAAHSLGRRRRRRRHKLVSAAATAG